MAYTNYKDRISSESTSTSLIPKNKKGKKAKRQPQEVTTNGEDDQDDHVDHVGYVDGHPVGSHPKEPNPQSSMYLASLNTSPLQHHIQVDNEGDSDYVILIPQTRVQELQMKLELGEKINSDAISKKFQDNVRQNQTCTNITDTTNTVTLYSHPNSPDSTSMDCELYEQLAQFASQVNAQQSSEENET